jgi:hypothetical protein
VAGRARQPDPHRQLDVAAAAADAGRGREQSKGQPGDDATTP